MNPSRAQEQLDGVRVPAVVKTSRFSSLFAPDSGNTEAPSHEAADLVHENTQTETKTPDVPRYKAPKNGQGSKAPPTPPAAFGDPNPKRLYLDNVPYAARKQDIIAFFDGFNV